MNATKPLSIEVLADWTVGHPPQLMGILQSQRSRGSEIFSFEFDPDWLKTRSSLVLDPQIMNFRGRQFNPATQPNFGIFLDSSPDRWGRTLQKKRAAILARSQGLPTPQLVESDYLLGVHDEHRIGGLRFRKSEAGPFLDDSKKFSTPPMTSIRELQAAAWALENDESLSDPQTEKWLRMLIAPGGSLGGARPKASVISESEELWIAKFPSREDKQDTGAWEYVVHQLAVQAGLDVPEAQVQIFAGNQHTFLSKRFDRIGRSQRLHFASAMTLLGKTDGAAASDGTSYLELAEFIMANGALVEKNLEELWRRIVFHICVSNTDDHLRNHGFLLTSNGWVLSKAFDLNPNPDGNGLKLNISENDNSQDLELATEVASFFRLKPSRAKEIRAQVTSAVRKWQEVASTCNISRSQQQLMSEAFRVADNK